MTEQDGRFREFIEEVRARSPLVEVVGEMAGNLERSGEGFKCSSPIRSGDSDPSFYVYDDSERWYDFGTQEHGDVFDLVEKANGLDFRGAVDFLADRCGLRYEHTGNAYAAEFEDLVERRWVETLLGRAAAYYNATLPPELRAWITAKYGIDDATIDRLKIGFARGDLLETLRDDFDVPVDRLEKTGLFIRTREGLREFFKGRVVFFYWLRGRARYAIARRVDGDDCPEAFRVDENDEFEKAKYKKLLTHKPDKREYVSTTISNEWFFGEDDAHRASELLVITEGVTDCIMARQAGHASISPVTISFRDKDWPRLVTLTERCEQVVIVNDDDEAGARGALKTAAHLFEQGRDVRVARLPGRADGEKQDLASFVRDGGDLDSVLRTAPRYIDTLVEQIPTNLDPAETSRRLDPVVALVAARPEVERALYTRNIAKRFKLPQRVVKGLLDEAARRLGIDAADAQSGAQGEGGGAERVRGTVSEDLADHYVVDLGTAGREVISSFTIRPRKLVSCEIGTLVEGDVVTEKGLRIEGAQIPPGAWASTRGFTRAVNDIHPSCTWTGSDANVQGVLRLLTSNDLPTTLGTTVVGRHETPNGPRWASLDNVLDVGGVQEEPDLTFVDAGGSSAFRFMSFRPVHGNEARALAKKVLSDLLLVNSPLVTLPLAGFFFACVVKPIVLRAIGHFPIAFVWGSRGGGKTSTVRDVFMPIVGAAPAFRPLSVTETPFALIRALGGSNAVPLFLDEYRSDMGKQRIETLHRFLRRVYGGEIEERGRADQGVNSYSLSAPVVIAGESYPASDAALRERLILVNPNPNYLRDNPEARERFTRITRLDLNALATPWVRFSLSKSASDIEAMLDTAKTVTDNVLRNVGRPEVPIRMFDNLVVMHLGLALLEEFADLVGGVDLGDLSVEASARNMVDELLEGEGPLVKDAFDGWLEALSECAISGALEEGKHYAWLQGKLCVHIPSAHRLYLEVQRRAGLDDETNGPKALRRAAREKIERGDSYVIRLDHRIQLGTVRARCVEIDPEKVPTTLSFEAFPCNANRTHGGGKRFGWDAIGGAGRDDAN